MEAVPAFEQRLLRIGTGVTGLRRASAEANRVKPEHDGQRTAEDFDIAERSDRQASWWPHQHAKGNIANCQGHGNTRGNLPVL